MISLALLVGPLVCGFTVVSAPSTNTPVSWTPASVTMTYPQGHPTDITDGSDVTAVQSAFAAWNHVACSAFRYTDGGPVASAATNTIEYVTDSADFASAAVLAYTVRAQTAGHWTSAVVHFNDFAYHWATTGDLYLADNATKAYDFQSTLTHELGHALGLGHSADPEATMYFGGREGRTYFRTLGDDDIRGVCFLYPVSTIACTTNADCPLQDTTEGGAPEVTICAGSSCVPGQRGYGQDCFTGTDCTTGTCTRFDGDAVSADPGQCTQSCSCAGTSCTSCPGGDACNGTVCAPRAADCVPGCTGSYECLPDVDGDFTCTLHCTNDTTPAHPCDTQGEVCFNGPSDASPGLCRTPGPKKTGLSCEAPSDCASLVCTSGSDGAQTCVGAELAPPTILTDPPPQDSGPTDDGVGGGDNDGEGSSDGGDFVGKGDVPSEPGGKTSGGCAETAPSFLVVAIAVLLALCVRPSRA